jgi:hypothetical protein
MSMKEIHILAFDELVADNGRDVFLQAETPQGLINLRFSVSSIPSLHNVLVNLRRVETRQEA